MGLAAYLLGIREASILRAHPLRGSLFENFIIAEVLKQRFNQVADNNLYFFRDNKGHEVDLLRDFGYGVHTVEIKVAKTFSTDFLKGLRYYAGLNPDVRRSYLVYTGEHRQSVQDVQLLPYESLTEVCPE